MVYVVADLSQRILQDGAAQFELVSRSVSGVVLLLHIPSFAIQVEESIYYIVSSISVHNYFLFPAVETTSYQYSTGGWDSCSPVPPLRFWMKMKARQSPASIQSDNESPGAHNVLACCIERVQKEVHFLFQKDWNNDKDVKTNFSKVTTEISSNDHRSGFRVSYWVRRIAGLHGFVDKLD